MTLLRKLLAFLLGTIAVGVSSGQAVDRMGKVGEPIQRLHSLRAAYLAVLITNKVGASFHGDGASINQPGTTAKPGTTAEDDSKIAQWGNFPNFPNFPNFGNWNNWFNGWRNF
ncbi:hypothetical protein [Rhizobium leguminosarum]|uniref:hypothetical protein n=1 Tax=Rhizobium TaxID=379 RepID=UPI00140F89C1|nr:hypothetical protein [Rhizobium leguminosarum]MBY5917733.1 hypothetical protein [Rhizobium leguminosarum]QIO66043.1 hypothetical protein HA462_13715 [Rhizobium leguminosarum bv. trifolii]